jgi:predicted dienelactone hydrolase
MAVQFVPGIATSGVEWRSTMIAKAFTGVYVCSNERRCSARCSPCGHCARSRCQVVSAAETAVGFTFVSVLGDTALRGDASGRLNVVWYPAPRQTVVRAIAVGPPNAPYFVEGESAKDAPIANAPGPRPFVVVVSHGTGGTAMDLAWLCAGLAARGYIVAVVNHPGNNALARPTVAGNTVWWLRANDLSRVIDGLLAMPRFGPRIDRARIGAAGLSLGGFTVLVLAGARADSRLLGLYCAHKPKTPVCSGEATPEIPNLKAKARALAADDAKYRAAGSQRKSAS